MEVTLVNIASIKAAPYNPRTINRHEFESLQRSIDEFGFVEPVVVNKLTNHIVGGHMRVEAAKALGMEQVPVTFVELDDKKEKALNIALNKISGEFDTDLLAELLTDLDDDLTGLTGFTDEEIQKLQDGWVDHDDLPADDKPKTLKWSADELFSLWKLHQNGGGDNDVPKFISALERLSEAR